MQIRRLEWQQHSEDATPLIYDIAPQGARWRHGQFVLFPVFDCSYFVLIILQSAICSLHLSHTGSAGCTACTRIEKAYENVGDARREFLIFGPAKKC